MILATRLKKIKNIFENLSILLFKEEKDCV